MRVHKLNNVNRALEILANHNVSIFTCLHDTNLTMFLYRC